MLLHILQFILCEINMALPQNPSFLQNAIYNLTKMRNRFFLSNEELKSLVLFLNSFICLEKTDIVNISSQKPLMKLHMKNFLIPPSKLYFFNKQYCAVFRVALNSIREGEMSGMLKTQGLLKFLHVLLQFRSVGLHFVFKENGNLLV